MGLIELRVCGHFQRLHHFREQLKDPKIKRLLLFAELLIVASAALTAAWSAKTAACTWAAGVLGSTCFGNHARPTAYQLFHRAAAFWAKLDVGFGHLLSPLESAVARFALIVVRGHSRVPLDKRGACFNYTESSQFLIPSETCDVGVHTVATHNLVVRPCLLAI